MKTSVPKIKPMTRIPDWMIGYPIRSEDPKLNTLTIESIPNVIKLYFLETRN